MEIREITTPDEKRRITRFILESLPDWFGIPEAREEYIEKIEAADSQEQAQELQMEANDEMVSIIEEVGMDIPTYNSIATAYSSEPQVRNRIDALM